MQKETNPRLVAYQVLNRLEEHRSNSNVLLQEALSRIPDASDRALVTELVLGVLRWRGALLYHLARFSRRPLEQIDSRVQVILQMGIYQLLHTRIPHHAAIYETVNLCRRIRMTSAASFANGILRGVQGKMTELAEPPDLAPRWSHPQWLVDRWVERYGEAEAVALMSANNETPAVCLRVNSLRTSPEAVIDHLRAENVALEPYAPGSLLFRVKEGAPQQTRSFVDGEFYIQDAGVEVLGQVYDARPGQRVLEIAAAPGGKTFQLAMYMKNTGCIVSLDSDSKRMKMWRRNIDRLGIGCALPVIADARALPFRGAFDLVIVDAPCSSLGVVRRHPEIKWWRRPEEMAGFGGLQLQILEACATYVGGRGVIVYSVCSFEPEETSRVCEAFLERHPGFVEVSRRTLLPHRDGADGFFVARFEKREA